MSGNQEPSGQLAVTGTHARIVGLGVRALDRRRVDVAVDLTFCRDPLTVEMVIVGPAGDELCSMMLVDHCEPTVDKVLHLRREAQPGQHILHVGIFFEDLLVDRATRWFAFLPCADYGSSAGQPASG